MMKLAWGLVSNQDRLQVKVMRNKYKWGEDLLPNIRGKKKVSTACRGIINQGLASIQK